MKFTFRLFDFSLKVIPFTAMHAMENPEVRKLLCNLIVAVDLINGGKGPDLKADTPT